MSSGNTGRYSKVAVEESVLSDKQTVAAWRPGVRVPVVIITTLITALASVVGTYFATHGEHAGDCATSGEVNAVAKRVDELQTSVTALTTTVNKNADAAHNETAELRNTVQRNADNATGGVQRISDKLDLFMRR